MEREIKERDFIWRHRPVLRQELAIKLKVSHVFTLWLKEFEIIADRPFNDDIERLNKQLKPFTEDYGDMLPEIIELYNELELGLIENHYTTEDIALSLANRAVDIEKQLQFDITRLRRELDEIRSSEK